MDDAIEGVRRMTERVRDQAYPRFAFPWRFEGYPLAERADPPTDAELEAWMQELEFRYQRAIEGDEEL